jgi:hypothetical protein
VVAQRHARASAQELTSVSGTQPTATRKGTRVSRRGVRNTSQSCSRAGGVRGTASTAADARLGSDLAGMEAAPATGVTKVPCTLGSAACATAAACGAR